MASTKVTFVTGTAEVKRRDPYNVPPHPEQHFTTEPSNPSQVQYVDGKCTCCPYGYHIDLDFLNFCRDLESGSTLRNLKRIQRTKRKLRKSMELMLDEQEGIASDPNLAPPDVVHSTEAGRLMHMINYERSASHRILSQIDSSVNNTISNMDGDRGSRNMSSDSDEPVTPYTPPSGPPHTLDESSHMTPSFSTSGRTDSLSSLSSVSTVSSEAPMMHQAQLVTQQHQHYQHTLTTRTTTKVVENPVVEMGTAEMKHYSTTSSAQLAEEPPIPKQPVAPVRTPPLSVPRASPDVNQMSLQSVREAMALSLHRMRELEEQVKTIPILQVRISVLKEEKRLLNLQLKASKASNKPSMTSIGVGDGRVDTVEQMDRSFHYSRQLEMSRSFSTETSVLQSPTLKTPPPTLPKPVRTVSVGVGDHSVIEPYNLQPDLPTGYTIRENETHTEIHTATVIEREKVLMNRIQAPSLNLSFRQPEHTSRETRLSSSSQIETNQPRFTINQIQRSSPKALTRTIGVGDGNVFEGSGLHVHEKDIRTVIIGPNANVPKRNVGIECRVPTRDVGVSFMCDEEKPETRTVGVNVSYDTSHIMTALDFKGESELRVALRGVLQRNVHSVGTNCNFKPSTADAGVSTDFRDNVSVGCGDEDMRIDVEIRPATVKKSVATLTKPDSGHKCVGTEKGWTLDASTNTVGVDRYNKSVMTERQRQAFASTNTDPPVTFTASNQTEMKMFVALNQAKHAESNTENPILIATGVVTDTVPTFSVGVNTTEKVTDLFQTNVPTVSTEKKAQTVDKGVGGNIEDDSYSFSETTEVYSPGRKSMTVQEQILQRGASQASAFLSQSELTRKAKIDDGDKHFSSYEIMRRSSAPAVQHSKSSQDEVTCSEEQRSSSLERVSPPRPEESFSETVVEHYIITKDGKKLISEEKTTTSSQGSNHTFKKYTDGGDAWSQQTSTLDASSSSSSGEEYSYGDGHGGYDSSYSSSVGDRSSKVEKSFSSVVTNPYKTVENLAAASSMLDSDSADDSANTRQVSKTSSEGNLYKKKKTSQKESSKSVDSVYKMRRAGSVEDFMPDDIRKYMSIDPSTSKDSGFGEDLLQRFSEESSSSSSSSPPSAAAATTLDTSGEMQCTKTSTTVTTVRTIQNGDKVSIQETKTVEGPDGQIITTVTETSEDGQKMVTTSGEDSPQHLQILANQNGSETVTSSSYSTSFSSVGLGSSVHSGSDSNLSSDISKQRPFPERGHFNTSSSISYSETSMSTLGGDADGGRTEVGNYGSLDRRTGKLKSIMKHRSTESEGIGRKKGITFAESVTGGTGSSSEENSSDSDSTTSFEEGSYDSQQGEVIYKCKDDEAIAQGLPGAQMFDQNIRETYELPDEIRDACTTMANYLMDSTTIQTKQLNASRNTVQQEWFQVSSLKLSNPHQVEDFLSSVNEISKRLLEYIVNMTDANGNTAIHYCISHCNFEVASLLLDSEVCDINKQNKAGYTPIMLAGLATVQNMEQAEVIRRLFAMGDINARAATTEQTALMLAASHGRTEMVKLLVEEGANINIQDVDGSTALMCACEHGHLEIVNFLLAQPNINAHAVDNENSTALAIAMEAGHKDVGVVLYKHLNFSKATSPGYHKKRKSSSSPTPSTFVIR